MLYAFAQSAVNSVFNNFLNDTYSIGDFQRGLLELPRELPGFLVVFVSATLLGFASHAPGGLGVFDAAMLVALWEYDRESLLAGLLLFRLLYYIVPFAISLAILGTRELVLSFDGKRGA